MLVSGYLGCLLLGQIQNLKRTIPFVSSSICNSIFIRHYNTLSVNLEMGSKRWQRSEELGRVDLWPQLPRPMLWLILQNRRGCYSLWHETIPPGCLRIVWKICIDLIYDPQRLGLCFDCFAFTVLPWLSCIEYYSVSTRWLLRYPEQHRTNNFKIFWNVIVRLLLIYV